MVGGMNKTAPVMAEIKSTGKTAFPFTESFLKTS